MKSRSARIVVGFALSIAALLGAVHFASGVRSDDTLDSTNYSEKIRQTYNFRFGKDNFTLPGNAATETNDFIQAGAFPKAEYCAHCHEEAYHQWRQALHSNSFRTPFYRASVNILIRSKGVEFTRHCDSCHNPIAVVSGGLTQESHVDRRFDRDGLTCSTCHSVQKLQSTSGNGGYVMGVPAVMVDEKGNRIPGEVPYADILAHPDQHSKAVMQSFYREPEFCAACHKANLPNPLNEYKFIRAFTVYDEWQNSKFSKRNPLTFYSQEYFIPCQGCHMRRAQATLTEYGAKAGWFSSHRWLAGNTAVPYYYGFDEQLRKTIEFLKAGNFLNVDIFALKKASDDQMIAPLGSVPFELKPNDVVEAYVVVQNKNIGHSLIPEVRDLYESWVEMTVKDADGNEIYHSGFLKPDGMLDTRAHSFTNRPVNVSGEFVDNHKVWTIHSMAYDNSIQSGRSALVRYEFQVPPNAKGPLSVTARVNYRHLRQSYLNNVLGPDHPAYPVVEMASRTRALVVGMNQPTSPDASDNQDWMRWNNLGIGFIDQQQYSDAVEAFEHVVKLRPDYEDGYVNVGLAYIEWEKYSSARPSVEKALQLHPDYARALYYLALVERREGHPEAEVADLQRVVELYPQSRDARRELGIAYYQQHRSEDAITQFQALQAIDPDDLAAHYNLAVLYRRKGMKAEAAEQAALYATKRIDPAAPTYSLDFLRKHPEISTESVPWHMHTDREPTAASASGNASSQN
ncbi:MAG TPA: tetratricopeptide repeat protein [Candidatus Eremiobacteraceae bacterium]|nr:tetratricopeptide repeat protein [Candidatus Eremiobacteraceae bacterium]